MTDPFRADDFKEDLDLRNELERLEARVRVRFRVRVGVSVRVRVRVGVRKIRLGF